MALISATQAWPQTPAPGPIGAQVPLRTFLGVLNTNQVAASASLGLIRDSWRDSYAAPLLELVAFVPVLSVQTEVLAQLEKITGLRSGGDLNPLYEWLWARAPGGHPDYAEFKAALYEQVDPRFREYFGKERKSTIRLDEIRWGGVWRDGIPPLKNPKMISAKQARYLADADVVFGVAIDGDVRAYPKRILAWHEMVKDRIAGRELNGVYCTLCGSMILYDATVNGVHYELGTSGFLYRSNKLMYDHATKSLWSTLEGTPVVGPLVGKGIELQTLRVVTTTWGAWRKRHPGTTVLSLDTGHQRDYDEGAAYRDYFSSDRLMFGVPKLDVRLPNKAEVLALRTSRSPAEQLAISAGFLSANRVYHGRIGTQAFVVLTDASGANRVYESGSVRFTGWDEESAVRDSTGKTWKMTEDGLSGPGGASLKRLPAHRAFWFGWYAAYPATRLVK
ncbi:MAG: DUF3179 domain-containing protein [Betaproteobacteria bacterium]